MPLYEDKLALLAQTHSYLRRLTQPTLLKDSTRYMSISLHISCTMCVQMPLWMHSDSLVNRERHIIHQQGQLLSNYERTQQGN